MTYDADAVVRLRDPQAWADAGVETPDLIDAWWSAGFAVDDVGEWFKVVREILEVRDQPLDLLAMPAHASVWVCAGFTPKEARAWLQTLVNFEDREQLVHEARRWRAAGFTPDDASRWRQWGNFEGEHDLDTVLLFEAAGWYPGHAAAMYMLLSRHNHNERDDDVRRWLALNLGTERTLNYVKAAVTTAEALALEAANLRPSVLEAELQARFEAATPIDPYIAMHLNHQCYLHFGLDEEDDNKWPFWAHHIRDLHDEDRDANR